MLANIVGGSYQGKYIDMNPQKTINWYIQKDMIEDEDSKYKMALLPFPGLEQFLDSGKMSTRKIFVATTTDVEKCFFVADNTLYEIIGTDGTYNSIGVLTDILIDNSPVFMECNANNELMIATYSASYCYNMQSQVLTKITHVNFPGNVEYLSYTHGYMIVTSGGRVYYNLNNILTWDALNVFTPGAYSNKLIAAIVWRDDIHCFCQESIEIYINDGTPFSQQARSTIDVGLNSATQLAKYHEGILFVGQTKKGKYRVFYYNAVECKAISTVGVEYNLNNPFVLDTSLSTWSELTEFTWSEWMDLWNTCNIGSVTCEIQYNKDSHIFFYLSIPTLNTTYVFDAVSKEWTERQSYSTYLEQDSQFRGTTLVNWQGLMLWTDFYSGKILKESYDVATELGNTITRTRISEVYSQEKQNLSIYEFELDCTSGKGLLTTPATDSTIDFYYSRDGGNTYGAVDTLSTGALGEYDVRSRSRKLGTARNWAFKLVQTAPAFIMIQSAILHGVLDNY